MIGALRRRFLRRSRSEAETQFGCGSHGKVVNLPISADPGG
jgi:hypothetical protein